MGNRRTCKSCCYFSALEGMYSGSSVANTVGSGSVTIPVMKKAGYDKDLRRQLRLLLQLEDKLCPQLWELHLMAEMTETSYATIVCRYFSLILYFSGIFLMGILKEENGTYDFQTHLISLNYSSKRIFVPSNCCIDYNYVYWYTASRAACLLY